MSLIAHYPFNGNANDIAGRRNGVVSGGLGYTNGLFGQALHFTGGGQVVTIPHDEEISAKMFGVATRVSMSCWFRPDSFSNYGCLLAKAFGGSWSNSTFGVWTISGGVRAVIGTNQGGNPSNGSAYTSIISIPLTEWSHIAATCDGETLTLYINGVVRSTQTVTNTLPLRSQNGSPITIGPRHPGDPHELRGRVQDVKLYDHALSKREVVEDALGPVARYSLLTDTIRSSVREPRVGSVVGALLESTGGYRFDGVDDYIVLDSDDFEVTQYRGSWSVRFETDDPAKDQMIAYTKRCRDRGIAIHNGHVKVGMYNGSAWSTLDGGPVPSGECHVVLSWDIDLGTLFCFVNGTLKDSLTISGGWTTTGGGAETYLGEPTVETNWLSITGFFVGTLRDVRVYGTVLSSDIAETLAKTKTSIHNNGTLAIRDIVEARPRSVSRGGLYMVNGAVVVAAYVDNTVIYRNGVQEAVMNAGDLVTVNGSTGDLLTSNGTPFTTGTSSQGVPVSWAGYRFAFRCERYSGTNTLRIFSPHGTAKVDLYRSDAPETINTTVTIDKDQVALLDTAEIFQYEIRSDLPVCVYFIGAGGTGDMHPMFPVTSELYGVASGSAHIVALEDNTELTVYRSDGTQLTSTINRLGHYGVTTGSQYSGPTERVVASKPVGSRALADADGGDATPYASQAAMSTEFLLPNDAEFVKLIGYAANATVDVYDASGTLTQSHTVTGGSGPYPSDLKLTGTLLAGYKIVCSAPQLAILEVLSTDDETMLYGNVIQPALRPKSDGTGTGQVIEGEFIEAGILRYEHIAWYRMDFTPRDCGPNAFSNATQNLFLTDRGYEFRRGAIVSYIEALTIAQAAALLGDESDGVTVMASFESVTGAVSDARIVSRDASDYWAINADQNETFPQTLRVYTAGGSLTFPGVVTPGYHRVVMIRDVPNDTTYCFLDGVLLGTTGASAYNSSRGVTIGANEEGGPNPSSASYWTGRIEDVRILKGAVSEKDVMADYNRFLARGRAFSIGSTDVQCATLLES
jgi:hypothetical protein